MMIAGPAVAAQFMHRNAGTKVLSASNMLHVQHLAMGIEQPVWVSHCSSCHRILRWS